MSGPGGPVVREARKAEAEAVAALILAAFEEYRPLVSPAFMTAFEAEVGSARLRDGGGIVLVAEGLVPDGGVPDGLVSEGLVSEGLGSEGLGPEGPAGRFDGGPDSGRLVGTVTLVPDGSGNGMHGWPEAVPVLRLLATLPAARGRGIGRALAEACVARARGLGAREIGLHTAPFMRAARALYESLGFARAPGLDVQVPSAPPALAYLLQL